MLMTETDKIEKSVVLRAPRSRVWRAISDSREFGEWFKVVFTEKFAEGKTVTGRITHRGFENVPMEITIERIQPEEYFSYRWHPYAIDPNTDYSGEPTTLVEFRLSDSPDGTLLTITESGFDQIPAERRAEAFRMNDGGWTGQIKNIERYVTA
ncbi:MAG TPA: SRPBCC family protein [Gemmatimonadaceae bacterium]|nr:SRPBCC family protein [Gemmatimonadaceae bacterium]